MTRYQREFGARRRFPQRLLLLVLIIALAAIIGSVLVHQRYSANLRPVSSDTHKVAVTIMSGSSVNAIAEQLYNKHLIRSAETFEWYVNTHNQRDKLQAGTYSFSQSMSTSRIADAIANGAVATDLVTILPGQRLDQIRGTFIDAGFKTSAVDAALQASRYRDYPALADNPASASLEGFLYPDSYQKTAETDPSEIVAESLKEMQQHLTSDIRSNFAKHGLSVYQGVTLASVVEQEVAKPADRAKVAQVFLLRLKRGMTLGSDAANRYGKAIHDATAYDTYTRKGLPPSPIGTVSDGSLQAVAHPANTDWLYFVSGDNGTTYFSHTLEQHEANVAKYCHRNCSATGS